MILKLKAFIYRLTGIYLAKKEETKMLKKAKVKGAFNRSVIVGAWQVENGFYRTSKQLGIKKK